MQFNIACAACILLRCFHVILNSLLWLRLREWLCWKDYIWQDLTVCSTRESILLFEEFRVKPKVVGVAQRGALDLYILTISINRSSLHGVFVNLSKGLCEHTILVWLCSCVSNLCLIHISFYYLEGLVDNLGLRLSILLLLLSLIISIDLGPPGVLRADLLSKWGVHIMLITSRGSGLRFSFIAVCAYRGPSMSMRPSMVIMW